MITKEFPKISYGYYLIFSLQSYQTDFVLCPEQIMHNIFVVHDINLQAYEYFAQYDLKPEQKVTYDSFDKNLQKIFKIKNSETDCLFRFLSKNQQINLYVFFTYFDMILSTYTNSVLTYQIPILPTSYTQILSKSTQSFYIRLKKHINKLNLSIGDEFTIEKLAELLETVNISQDESIEALNLLKFNQNLKIRVYHL